ncbi:alpha/beta hydrolase family protein [Roseisalinus antarcticus]|uniref:2,6-dihydropseudooxynicotine hydrolase n=1 Tax=Roseisalinus antarcticus TaxID=254357 RepID=A0A1Y5TJR2_9RHOB|nr:alpha/beta fold hydrolase [Roseisalinus antarcticus]SLN65219.1 2,6-dihydropseudooxynicotine hydrolase [Roseisalinus antarcticus]
MSAPTSGAVDPRIVSAAAHWSHRFVSNGVPLADFQDVTGSITRWEDWCSAWTDRGAVHESLGDASLDRGHRLSAGEHYTTAAVCHHFGKFLFVHDREQMRGTHMRAVAARQKALALIDCPGERVEIDWNGHTLAGILRKPAGVARPALVIMVMGLDSAKEEMHSNEEVFLRRGLATLSFDGPGQGEAEYDLPIHPAYEEPVAAVVDYLATRKDIDADRLAVWGVSLGGYYAPRAAAFVDRLCACVSLTGPFDFAEAFDRAPPLTREAFIARSFAAGEEAAREVAARMTLEGVAGRIRCPVYIVGAALDRVLPADHAGRLARSVGGESVLNMIEDGTHVANNRPYKYRTQVGDWLADLLAT